MQVSSSSRHGRLYLSSSYRRRDEESPASEAFYRYCLVVGGELLVRLLLALLIPALPAAVVLAIRHNSVADRLGVSTGMALGAVFGSGVLVVALLLVWVYWHVYRTYGKKPMWSALAISKWFEIFLFSAVVLSAVAFYVIGWVTSPGPMVLFHVGILGFLGLLVLGLWGHELHFH